MRIKVNIKDKQIINNLKNNKTLWIAAAAEWHKLITPFTPYQTGNLSQNVAITAGKITYKSDYAKVNYYSINRNFRKDRHIKASAKWDKAAAPTQYKKLEDFINFYIKIMGYK